MVQHQHSVLLLDYKDGKLDGYDVDPDVDETTLVSHQYLMALNLTLNVDTTDYPADARIEYYKIDVNSDKGPVESICWFVGTDIKGNSVNSSFCFQEFIKNIHFARNDLFSNDTFGIPSIEGPVVSTMEAW